jgi:hypothetical protein
MAGAQYRRSEITCNATAIHWERGRHNVGRQHMGAHMTDGLTRDFTKVCRSFVSRWQNGSAILVTLNEPGLEPTMRHLPDHGLPLVQLKEQRRDLVVALQNRNGPISGWELMQIAAVQQAISAFEEVIADLDAEAEMEAAA